MASIFTWESDTPRVSSPWLDVQDANDTSGVHSASSPQAPQQRQRQRRKVRRLQAEPQEGPVEYKLHLLLRPRRQFSTVSTGENVSGSSRLVDIGGRTVSETVVGTTYQSSPESSSHATQTPMLSASTQHTRQHRLQQLTTQLLWRLQQSSPHHTSSATNIIFPSLPDASHELAAPQKPGKLLHGLEESQGALYEIGVSDDGSLIGLAEDELNESLNNLRAMAACLGCTVEVLRKEKVGKCRWVDGSLMQEGSLWVAEAFIKPCLQSQSPALHAAQSPLPGVTDLVEPVSNLMLIASEQLRVTLTGPTMSGKSTLLGTLTTSTLDSGRGKSRLGMLRHRHEINTGITSSVTQELLGYQDLPSNDVEVINYATENVASWVDIHAASADNRVVFISDSAGHPRYRRTTIRGLVGWAPHWTLLCISANDGQSESDSNEAASAIASGIEDVDLAGAQLNLCLSLELPLVIVITKLDLALRTSLRATLTRILDTLKAAGRKPVIFPNATGSGNSDDLSIIDNALVDKACDVVVPLLNNTIETVPIVLTSAVQGTGISNLHALLHELPIPISHRDAKTAIFYIEDIYSKPAETTITIVSGLMRSGEIEVGDNLVVGPFALQDHFDDSEDSDERSFRRNSRGHLPASRSFPGALPDIGRYALPGHEWKRYTVVSIRNLRLPVHSLSAGQVGTVAIAPIQDQPASSSARIRKGMVLTPVQPSTARNIKAEFDQSDFSGTAIGSHVVVYIASIRASARIVSAQTPGPATAEPHDTSAQDPFDFEDDTAIAGQSRRQTVHVLLSFDSSREFVLVGDKILVMPGGGPALLNGQERGQKGMAGLDGFVGKIVEVVN